MYPAEYKNILLNTATHTAYDIHGNATTFTGISNNITGGCSAAHGQYLIDNIGQVYASGDNTSGETGTGTAAGTAVSNMTLITQDSAGHPFNGIVQIASGLLKDSTGAGGWTTAFIKSGQDTVWAVGFLSGGGRGIAGFIGSVATLRPVPIKMPEVIVQVTVGNMIMARSITGKVYSWGGGNNVFNFKYMMGQGTTSPNNYSPTLCPLPNPAIDIAGGVTGVFALLNNNHLYACGPYLGLIGAGSTDGGNNAFQTPGATNASFFDITSTLNLPAAIKHIYSNSIVNYALLVDSTAWVWGDNVCGSFGNGTEPDFRTVTSPPYAWNISFGDSYSLVKNAPTQIAPGLHNIAAIFTGASFCYYGQALLGDGRLIMLGGRQKGGIGGNGIVDCDNTGGMNGTYPNSWDVLRPETISPVGASTFGSNCPACDSLGGSPCSNCSPPATHNVTPVLTATYIGNHKVVLDASGSTSSASLHLRFQHEPVSCSDCSMRLQGDATDTIIVAGSGYRTTQVTVKDQYWQSKVGGKGVATTQLTFYVPPPSTITVPSGVRRHVIR